MMNKLKASPFVLGFVGAVAALMLAALMYAVVLLWVGARHGEAAYWYIDGVIKAQQAAQRASQQKDGPPHRP
jgi:hypothetical protein